MIYIDSICVSVYNVEDLFYNVNTVNYYARNTHAYTSNWN